jgi:hypothetical protein
MIVHRIPRLAGTVALAAAVLSTIGPSTVSDGTREAGRLVWHARKGAFMTRQATGTFNAKVQPLPGDEKVAGLKVGRFGVDKEFAGGLVATSKVEMMAPESSGEGTGGYVAVEFVAGTLDGRTGTFALLHQGTMAGGNFKLSVIVAPGSGTGQLAGLAGAMAIVIEGKKHSYTFDYTLP